MSHLPGLALALVLVAVYAWALRSIWSAPFKALGILVAGMAVHNFLIMVLLRLDTPAIVVRVVQAWKEGILVVLFALALLAGLRAWRSHQLPSLQPLDVAMLAFAALALLYTALPPALLHGTANTAQRLLGIRVLLLLPALYLFGRVFQPQTRGEMRWVAWAIAAAAAVVGLFGLVELWLVPTTVWFDWGVNQLSDWLGFAYNGPGGLPANFFQTTTGGFLLRRMVSSYVSPLGIAYAGLVVVPVALVLAATTTKPLTRWFAWVVTALGVTGVLFSLTRLALAALVAEIVLLALLLKRPTMLVLGGVVGLATVFMLVQYVYVGPLLERNLTPVAHRPAQLSITSTGDPSLREHAGLLGYDLRYVRQHPLGTGVGSSIHRFGPSTGTGESALLDMFGDLGILGGVLYLLIYVASFGVAAAAWFRLRRDPLLAMLPLTCLVGAVALAPISLTTDLWSDLATTFLFWWAAGASVSWLDRDLRLAGGADSPLADQPALRLTRSA